MAAFSCKLSHDLIRNLAQFIDIDGIDSGCQSHDSQHDNVWSYGGCVECKSSTSMPVIFAVTATTTTVPSLRGKTLLRDFNTQSGFSSDFSGFSNNEYKQL